MDPFAELAEKFTWFVTFFIVAVVVVTLARSYARRQIASGAWPMIQRIRDHADWLGVVVLAVIALMALHDWL